MADSLAPASADHPAPLILAGRPGFIAPARRVADLPGPRGWPVAGNLPQLVPGSVHTVLEGWSQRYGPMFRCRFGPNRAVVIAEAGLIDQILRHRPAPIGRAPRVPMLINELGFKGLFTAEGETWRRQRRLVMRALTPEAIRGFFPIIEAVTRRLEQRWRAAALAGRTPDIARDLKCYSIDVTTWLAMGVDIDTLGADIDGLQGDVETWFATIGRRMPMMFPYWRWIRLPQDRRTDAAVARLHAVVDGLIAGARAEMAADPQLRARPRNILQALVAAREEDASGFSDEDVHGNVAVMLFAGEDTTANAMAWLLFHLAIEPQAAARAIAEADAVLGSDPVVRAFGDLDALAYLEAASLESMRLKPIAPVQGMRANVDLDLAGLHVPRGYLMFLLARVAAMQASNFVQPQRFWPERWLRGAQGPGTDAGDAGEGHAGARSMFPFGGGPRHCPGRYLAMVEIKMVVSMVLRNFSLAIEQPQRPVGERFSFTMAPDAMPLRLAVR